MEGTAPVVIVVVVTVVSCRTLGALAGVRAMMLPLVRVGGPQSVLVGVRSAARAEGEGASPREGVVSLCLVGVAGKACRQLVPVLVGVRSAARASRPAGPGRTFQGGRAALEWFTPPWMAEGGIYEAATGTTERPVYMVLVG